MSTSRNTTCKIALALSATLIASTWSTAGAADNAPTYYSSETYGKASGDTPLPDLGLVLELVYGDTSAPSLRLFGGIPGNPATILISGGKAGYERDGVTVLVAGQPIACSGQFDWMGTFEVPLSGLPDRAAGLDRVYAQGIHTGAAGIDSTRGTIFEMSNGLLFFPTPEKTDAPFSITDVAPNLPEHRLLEMQNTDGLEGKLRVALNSPGDEVVVKLKANFSVAVIALVNVGAEATLEAKITRGDEGRYDVEIGVDAARKAGVEIADGNEVSMAQGFGGTRIFRFHSVSGVARGLKGLALALRFPNLQPARFAAEAGAFDAIQDQIEAMRIRHEETRQQLAHAEQVVFEVARQRLGAAHAQMMGALSSYYRTRAWVLGSRWRTPGMWAALGRSWGYYALTAAHYHGANLACNAARAAVDAARDVAETAREALHTAVDAAARVGRIVLVIGQTVDFAKTHYAGSEVRMYSSAQAEVTIGLPGVKLSNIGAGMEAELSTKTKVRWEKKTDHAPRKIMVIRELEKRGKVYAGYGAGAELESKRTIELVDAFEIGVGETRWAEHSATLKSDTAIAGIVGALAYQKFGAGRTSAVWINQQDLLKKKLDVLTLLAEDGAGAALGGMGKQEVGFSIQDRHIDTIGFGAGASYAGYGGGIEGSIEWTDKGEMLEKSTTIKEAIENLVAKVN